MSLAKQHKEYIKEDILWENEMMKVERGPPSPADFHRPILGDTLVVADYVTTKHILQ